MFSGRSTSVVIINYLSNYATLGHLVDSVKPGGKLTNTIAEIGIHVINGKKKRGATRWVMPLYITTFLQSQQICASAVKHALTKSENNLNHRQLVLFPVLQRLVSSDIQSGHYFLIVLNLRNNRFEVLDSMRTLENEALAQCCNTITSGIKQLWKIYYAQTLCYTDTAQTTKQIENNETVQIPVPKQTNNHDCGFHMLMHAQHWDGRLVCELHEKDIPNIRKILAHTWLSYEENDVDWESILNAEYALWQRLQKWFYNTGPNYSVSASVFWGEDLLFFSSHFFSGDDDGTACGSMWLLEPRCWGLGGGEELQMIAA
ncbi:hypothetical protein PVAP13_4NG083617 [Panicum virgatum]|uniref:Ubiquitin-like protease family profile domain-containing protein n=1 Tax=Panicum virgatum TaxID=38727 RepID=A0A8T0T1H1_PANVG|nr:hypothetical protein PVAP13_4NG083617 [Panicum virgatum]